MTTSINTNIAAYFAQANINAASTAAQNSVARLSSGNAIVNASDNVAALATGTSLATQVSALKTAQTNAAQGSSLLQVADGALAQIQGILQQQQSLALQAGSGSLTDTDRAFLNQQFSALTNEIDSLAGGTTFNGVGLLDGSISGGATINTNTTNGSTALSASSAVVSFAGGNATAADTFTIAVAGQAAQTFTFGSTAGKVGVGLTAADSASNLAAALNNSGLSQLADFKFSVSGTTVSAYYTGHASSIANIPQLTTSATSATITTPTINFTAATQIGHIAGTVNAGDTITVGSHTIKFVANGTDYVGNGQGAAAGYNATTVPPQVDIGLTTSTNGITGTALHNLTNYLNSVAGTTGFEDLSGINFTTDSSTNNSFLYAAYSGGGSSQPTLSTSYTALTPTNFGGGASQTVNAPTSILTLDSNSLTAGASTITVGGATINVGTAAQAAAATASLLTTNATIDGSGSLSNTLTNIVSYLNGTTANGLLGSLAGATFSTNGTQLFVTNPANVPTTGISTTLTNGATNADTITPLSNATITSSTGTILSQDTTTNSFTSANSLVIGGAHFTFNASTPTDVFALTGGDFDATSTITVAGQLFTVASGAGGSGTTTVLGYGGAGTGAAGDTQVLTQLAQYLNANTATLPTSTAQGTVFAYSANADGSGHKGLVAINTTTGAATTITAALTAAGGAGATATVAGGTSVVGDTLGAGVYNSSTNINVAGIGTAGVTNATILNRIAAYLNTGNGQISSGLGTGITFSTASAANSQTSLIGTNTTNATSPSIVAVITGGNPTNTTNTASQTLGSDAQSLINISHAGDSTFANGTVFNIGGQSITVIPAGVATTGAQINNGTNTQILASLAAYLNSSGVNSKLSGGLAGLSFTSNTTDLLVNNNTLTSITGVNTAVIAGSPIGAGTPTGALLNNSTNASPASSVFSIASGHLDATSSFEIAGITFTVGSGTQGAGATTVLGYGNSGVGAVGDATALQQAVTYLNAHEGSLTVGAQGTTFAYSATGGNGGTPAIVATNPAAGTTTSVISEVIAQGGSSLAAKIGSTTLGVGVPSAASVITSVAPSVLSVTSGHFDAATTFSIGGVNFTVKAGATSGTALGYGATSNSAGDALVLQAAAAYLNNNQSLLSAGAQGTTFTYSATGGYAGAPALIASNPTGAATSVITEITAQGGGSLVGKAGSTALVVGTPTAAQVVPPQAASVLGVTSGHFDATSTFTVAGINFTVQSGAATGTTALGYGGSTGSAGDALVLTEAAAYLNAHESSLTAGAQGTTFAYSATGGNGGTPALIATNSTTGATSVITNITNAGGSALVGSSGSSALVVNTPSAALNVPVNPSTILTTTGGTTSLTFSAGSILNLGAGTGDTADITFIPATSTATATAGEVKLGANDAATLANLVTYLNSSAGQSYIANTAYAGLAFSSNGLNSLYVSNSTGAPLTANNSFSAALPNDVTVATNATLSAPSAVGTFSGGGLIGAGDSLTVGTPANNVATAVIGTGTTLSLNGTAFTFVASGGTGTAINLGANNFATLTNLATYLNTTAGQAIFANSAYAGATFTTDGKHLIATNNTGLVSASGAVTSSFGGGAATPTGATGLTSTATLASAASANVLTLGVDTIVFGNPTSVTQPTGLPSAAVLPTGNVSIGATPSLSTALTNAVAYLNSNPPVGSANTVFSTNGTQLFAQNSTGASSLLTSTFNSATTPTFTKVTGKLLTATGVIGLGAGVTSAQGTTGGSLFVSSGGVASAGSYGQAVDLSGVANNASFIGAFGGAGTIGAITANYVDTGVTGTSGVAFSVKVGDDTYTTNTITNAQLTGTAPVSLLFTGSNTLTSASEGGSFTLTLQPQPSIGSQNDASQLATGINAALSSVSAYQNRNVLSFNSNYSTQVNNVLTATLAGSSLAFNSDNFTNPSISALSVSAPSAGSTDAKITAVINGQNYTTTSGIGDSFNGGNEIVLVNQQDPNQTLTLTLGASGFANLTNQSNAAAFQTTLSSALGLSTATGGLNFQLGSTAAANVSVTIGSAKSDALFAGQSLDISTKDGAETAATVVTSAIDSVTSLRAGVGALESQFNFASAALQTSVQNQDAARGSLLDTDIAAESTSYATSQVKLQAGISVLAQANQSLQALLKLIG